jgi:translin
LKENFSKVTKALDKLDEDREKILKISRETIRECSVAIKLIHRQELSEYQQRIDKIEEKLNNLRGLVNKNPGYFYKYLKTPEQEYAEAIILHAITTDQKIPTHLSLNIDPLHYALGFGDVVGELRRFILDMIRESNIEGINKILEKMDEIYSYLFSLDYPSGLTKDLRHKTDVARKLLEKTRGDISLSVQMNTLSELLKEKNKET